MTLLSLRACGVLATVTLLSPSALGAQTTQEQPASCSAAAYRQFDFWVGDWQVHTPDGELAGTNLIEPIQDGCVLQENWSGAGGDTGTSFNIYDHRRGKWHQTWVSSTGLLLLLDGELQDGKMVLSGTTVEENDQQVLHRITWDPVEAGVVRQLWEASRDAGESWHVVFDGRYTTN